ALARGRAITVASHPRGLAGRPVPDFWLTPRGGAGDVTGAQTRAAQVGCRPQGCSRLGYLPGHLTWGTCLLGHLPPPLMPPWHDRRDEAPARRSPVDSRH